MVKLVNKTLAIDTSPHIVSGNSTERIMRHVVYALLPTVAFAIYAFGLTALLILGIATLSCVLTEYLLGRTSSPTSNTIKDSSAIITGILYGLTLPPGIPLWMVAIGGFICIALGKVVFGGLGCNIFNPALVGRAFLQAAFPATMTTWYPSFSGQRFSDVPDTLFTLPFASPVFSDALTGATPLAAMKFTGSDTGVLDLVLGLTSGSLGETCSLVILLGGIYLILRNMMRWQIPVGILLTVAVLSTVLHLIDARVYPAAPFMLFSGGLMLGAMFMATDMVAAPITAKGCFVYGAVIGALVVITRIWGGMPEGVMYAILMANAIAPHIDLLLPTRVFGRQSTSKSA